MKKTAKLVVALAFVVCASSGAKAEATQADLTRAAHLMAHYIANARACDEDWQKPLEKYLKAISRHFEDVTVKSFMKFVKDELAIVDGLKCDPASLADWRKKQEMFLWAFVY